jgi:hypothetical protein
MRRLSLLLPAAFVLSACGGDTSNESSADGPVMTTIQISESEFSLTPRTISLPQPGTYELNVHNDGQVTHALEIEGNGSDQESGDIGPGSTVTMRSSSERVAAAAGRPPTRTTPPAGATTPSRTVPLRPERSEPSE